MQMLSLTGVTFLITFFSEMSKFGGTCRLNGFSSGTQHFVMIKSYNCVIF